MASSKFAPRFDAAEAVDREFIFKIYHRFSGENLPGGVTMQGRKHAIRDDYCRLVELLCRTQRRPSRKAIG